MGMSMNRNRNEVEREIRETLGIVPSFFDELPDRVLDEEWKLFKHWELGDTAIPNKYKELLMLAVHAETHCSYCTLFHTEMARMYGATEEEIREASHLAKHTVGWSTYLNGTRADYEEFESQLHEIGAYMKETA